MSTIDEDEVWAFMDEVGTLFQEAIGRDLNDFDGDEGWQECHLKFFREMADELKRHGVRWDSDVGYISKLDEMRLVAANRDALRLERDTLQTSLHAAREEIIRLKSSLMDADVKITELERRDYL